MRIPGDCWSMSAKWKWPNGLSLIYGLTHILKVLHLLFVFLEPSLGCVNGNVQQIYWGIEKGCWRCARPSFSADTTTFSVSYCNMTLVLWASFSWISTTGRCLSYCMGLNTSEYSLFITRKMGKSCTSPAPRQSTCICHVHDAGFRGIIFTF